MSRARTVEGTSYHSSPEAISTPGDMDHQTLEVIEHPTTCPTPPATVKRKRTRNVDAEVRQQSRKRSRIGVKECIVCTNETLRARIPKLPHADADQHTSDVCFTGWKLHLNGQVATKGFDNIKCPQCTHLLDDKEVRKLAKGSTYVEPVQRSPRATCAFGAYIGKDDDNIFRCPGCQTRSCNSCKAPFHEGLTCDEHRNALRTAKDHAEHNRKSVALVKQISQPCPKCGINVQKIGGCDHMTWHAALHTEAQQASGRRATQRTEAVADTVQQGCRTLRRLFVVGLEGEAHAQ
ncbi:hypothetical protein LTR95_006557 [Oleoguttula sp. CCFEE 5521]